MDIMKRIAAALSLACATAALAAPAPLQAPPVADAVILITLDGARIEEVFSGLDLQVLGSTLDKEQSVEQSPSYQKYWAETPASRREKLMPFFWGTLMKLHGSVAGNPRTGSSVTLTNAHRFSYPGYAEILLGEAHDDVVKSNDRVRNPYSTVLEGLASHLSLPPSRAAVFASWNVFDVIVEHRRGTLTVNAGFEPFEAAGARSRELSAAQLQTPTPWDSVRHDFYTFELAMAYLRDARPRVLYLALGETDDWAHDGRYDRVLDAFRRTDAWLQDLWSWLQADPQYRNRTHLLITTDHGRGRTPQDWRNHGAQVEGAQDVWIALVSPSMEQRGEWQQHAPLRTNQIAATLAGWMGLDWNRLRPAAGRPIR